MDTLRFAGMGNLCCCCGGCCCCCGRCPSALEASRSKNPIDGRESLEPLALFGPLELRISLTPPAPALSPSRLENGTAVGPETPKAGQCLLPDSTEPIIIYYYRERLYFAFKISFSTKAKATDVEKSREAKKNYGVE